MDLVLHSFNGFPAATAVEFDSFLKAAAASGPGATKPTPIEKYLQTHPNAVPFVAQQKPPPESFATTIYFGVNAFALVDKSGKTLVYNVNLLHYEVADATDNVFGPLEQVVARVELVDKQSGQQLAQGSCIGRTGKSVGLGVEWKAWGLARALYKWTSAYYPDAPEEKERPQEEEKKA